MANRKLKIVLDTNIMISFLITNQLNKLDKQIISGKIMLLFSNELIEEFITVTQRPKLLKLFSKSDVESLLGFFFKYGSIIKIRSNVNICRDVKDDFLLNLALDGKADYLITGDKDLLEIKLIGITRIININDFLNIVE